jgi:two-component system, chemotaxis family, protein-glutamate methylesterase/glutaminase
MFFRVSAIFRLRSDLESDFILNREEEASSLQEVAPTPMIPAAGSRHAVGLVASAGGVAALSRVLCALPGDFPAPLLVVQHLAPHHRSWLAEILDYRIALTVTQVRGGERLSGGQVFVAPPDHHLVVRRGGILGLSSSARIQYSRPSADVLLISLARVCKERAIAVVLTGKGRDGAEGVLAIKRNGGMVIVQDEVTSQFFDMPEAAMLTGVADRVLPLEAIAPELVALVGRTH